MGQLDRSVSVIAAIVVAVVAWVVSPLAIIVYFLAVIPAAIARRRGRDFLGWWAFGVFLWPVAMIAVFLVSDWRDRCPYCDEVVSARATVCPHCQRELADEDLDAVGA